MGFPNVDDEELDSVVKLAVDFFDAPDLSAEGWSSIAAKDQSNRPFAHEAGKTDPVLGPLELEVKAGWFLSHGGAHFVPRDDGVDGRLQVGR